MTATALDIIEGVDLTADVPCGHSQHDQRHADEPAAYIVRFNCTSCAHHGTYPLCESGWRHMAASPRLRCKGCLARVETARSLRIVEVLR